MRNLVLESVYNIEIDLGQSAYEEDDPICFICMDSTEGLLYAATRSGRVLCLADRGRRVGEQFTSRF